jgi:chromosome partitioning protein
VLVLDGATLFEDDQVGGAGKSMKVVAFASQKGGSGKTTLAGHIAVEADRSGAGPVVMIDLDPQGSLTLWWKARADTSPDFLETTEDRLVGDLKTLEERGTRLVIIDTPPAITATIGRVVATSDLVVIPTRPSPHDLRAAGATVQLCDRLGKSIVFAINAATPRARITTEAVIALSHHGAVAPSVIHQRVDFASSMIDGRTVMELPNGSRSPEEIGGLWNFISDCLESRVRLRSGGFPSAFGPNTLFGGEMDVKGAA